MRIRYSNEISYLNAYRLIVGKTSYEELGSKGPFLLPINHEDPNVTLKYYESIEDYEKCNEIIKTLRDGPLRE